MFLKINVSSCFAALPYSCGCHCNTHTTTNQSLTSLLIFFERNLWLSLCWVSVYADVMNCYLLCLFYLCRVKPIAYLRWVVTANYFVELCLLISSDFFFLLISLLITNQIKFLSSNRFIVCFGVSNCALWWT